MYDLDELRRSPASRRAFMSAMAAGGLGLAASKLLASGLTTPSPVTPTNGAAGVPTDGSTQFAGIPGRDINEQVLNFALTLEILEADLYRQALNLASGKPLTAPLNSNANSYTKAVGNGGLNSNDAADGFLYLQQFTYVEAAHRDFLRTVLASLGAPAVQPNPGGYKFAAAVQPNILSILANILPLEETGVRAYLGALPYLTDLTFAQTAGTIFSTEARHSAVIAYTLGIDPGPRKMSGDLRVSPQQPAENTFEYYLKPRTVIQKASQFFA